MTTPGGVPNLPVGAITLDNIESVVEDTSVDGMRGRAVDRVSGIFHTSTGGNPGSNLSPMGVITKLFAGFGSVVANADPADIQGPDDLPDLLLDFIESLPVVGQIVGLADAIAGKYDGEDAGLLFVQDIFEPIRAALRLLSGGLGGGFATAAEVDAGVDGLKQAIEQADQGWQDLLDAVLTGIGPGSSTGAFLQDVQDGISQWWEDTAKTGTDLVAGWAAFWQGWHGTPAPQQGTVAEVQQTAQAIRASVAGGFTLQTFTASNPSWPVPAELRIAAEVYVGGFGGGGRGTVGGTSRAPNQGTASVAVGGRGGTSGGYVAEKVDAASLPAELDITVGAAATAVGADGGASSVAGLMTTTTGVGGIASPQGYQVSSSTPGGGGAGGSAQASGQSGVAAVETSGAQGGASQKAAGGTGGAVPAAVFNGVGGAGGPGQSGVVAALPLVGGGGGGGGSGLANGTGTRTGGQGGNGGYPGGGSGGGGAASGIASGGALAGGAPGLAAHGMVFLLWR